MIDTDEILVPTRSRTLVEFLHDADKEQGDADAITFMSVHYGTDASQSLPASGHFILGNKERALNPLRQGKESKFSS